MSNEDPPPDEQVAEEIRTLRLQLNAATQNAEDARQDAENAKREAAAATREAVDAKEQAEKAIADAGIAEQRITDAREAALNAEGAALNASRALEEVRKDAEAARRDLEATRASKDHDELEQKARTSLRGYVANVLSEIAAGVDDAAIHATSRDLTEGMSEGGIISPSRIGLVPGQDTETTVEFDLAIIYRQAEKKTHEGGLEVSAGISVLGLGATGRWATASEQQHSMDQHNRIRFSVPIKFASQRESR